MSKKINLVFLIFLLLNHLLILTNKAFAQSKSNSNHKESFGFLIYTGLTVNNALVNIPTEPYALKLWPETLTSFELNYALPKKNAFSMRLNPIVNTIQIAMNFSLRNGKNEKNIFEFDPYVCFRWEHFSWDSLIVTTFAIGEGFSYTTAVPKIEKKNKTKNKRFLNYLMFESTFALPSFSTLQLVFRIHHRSGAYGLYHANNGGSNNIGLGFRILF